MLDLTREGRFNAGEQGLEGEDPWNEDKIVLNGEGKGERERKLILLLLLLLFNFAS